MDVGRPRNTQKCNDIHDDVDGQPGEIHALEDWIFQPRNEAWNAWEADVAAMTVASARDLEEALVNADAQAVSATHLSIATARAQKWALEQAWPWHPLPTRTIPRFYFDD